MPRPLEYYTTVLAIVMGLVLFALGVFKAHEINQPSPQETLKFNEGYFSPGDVLDYQSVELPHDWLFKYPDISQAWYRFEFELTEAPLVLQSVYFPTASQNLVVYINGVEVGNGGSLEKPIARHWPRPLMFPVAPDFFQSGRNELLIFLLSDPPGRGLLPEFFLGDRPTLMSAYSYRTTLKVMAPISFAIVLLILSLMLIAVTLGRSNDTQYAWGGATFLGLVGHSLPMILTRIPVSTFFWEWWQHTCIGYTLLFITIFIHRFLDIRRDALEHIIFWFISILTVTGLAVGMTGNEAIYFNYFSALWGPVCLLIGIIPAYTIAVPAFKDRNLLNILVFSCGFLLFFFGMHDALFVMGVVSRESGYLIHYASPLIALVYTAILFQRFVQTSREAEELNLDLERRITIKSNELKETYQRLQMIEREQVISQERERMNSEMHDGLGGYLAGALALAEERLGTTSQVVTTLRDATDEMRLMIDSAEASEEDIGMVIGTLRPKLERQCDMRGFTLIWDVQETRSGRSLGPTSALHLIRIVQEAVTNAVKHSGGDLIKVSIRDGEYDSIELSISDNGQFTDLSRTGGRGVYNIQKRVDQLEAQCAFVRSVDLNGLSVNVSLPSSSFILETSCMLN